MSFKKYSHRGGIVLMTLFVVVGIIFASGAIAVYTVFMKPENQVKVPSFVGMSIVDAVAEAERAGLVLQVEQVASTLPEGRVLAQSPEAENENGRGSVIVVQVSKSGELHAVPDVKGRTLSQAQSEIKSQGFSLGDVIKIHEPGIQAGIVIAQSPSSPQKVPSGRKIDLLVQEGPASDGVVTVPDVNRMTEQEARSVLSASGVKVQGVDRVYSPLLPEGLAIETRPQAGSTIRAGQGVILKLATQRRPAGFMGNDSRTASNPNGTVRRVTSQNSSSQTQQQSQSQSQSQSSSASPRTASTTTVNTTPSRNNQEEEFIGDDYTISTPAANSRASNTNTAANTAANVPSRPVQNTQTQAQNRQASSQAAQDNAPSGRSKTAKIRYVVPPIAKPMNLRIEVTDPSGKRDVMNRQVRSGESISTTASYTQECVVTIYLGGEFVWQERQK